MCFQAKNVPNAQKPSSAKLRLFVDNKRVVSAKNSYHKWFFYFFVKKVGQTLAGLKITSYLCTRKWEITCMWERSSCKKIGIWCNGNTADSGPAFPGSSPGIPTVSERVHLNKMHPFTLSTKKRTYVSLLTHLWFDAQRTIVSSSTHLWFVVHRS